MKKLVILVFVVILAIACVYIYKNYDNSSNIMKEYISKISNEEYSEMYEMISDESKKNISKEDFITRNKNIYNGIELTKIDIFIKQTEKISFSEEIVSYVVKMNTCGGEISFENSTKIIKNNEKKPKIEWSSNLIFPNLNNEDKVKVSSTEAVRGNLLDRNGEKLATNGSASSIGIVPRKIRRK